MMRTAVISTAAMLIALTALTARSLAEDPAAQETLRRAIVAVGGQGRLGTLKAPTMWMQKGTYYRGESPIPFVAQYASKWPNWYRHEIENVYSVGVNGDRAFLSGPGGKRLLDGDELKEQLSRARLAWALFLFPLAGEDYSLSAIRGIDVNGRATVGFTASHSGGRDASFYFDAESYRIAKIETEVVTPQTGPNPVKSEAFYWDHKPHGGVLMPARYKLFYGGKLFAEAETVDVKVRATVDPQWFSVDESTESRLD